MLELTPDAEFYVSWMLATHRPTEHGYELMALPRPGGVGEQDAWLMEGIGDARATLNQVIDERRKLKEQGHR